MTWNPYTQRDEDDEDGMTFSPAEAEGAPDMSFGIEETERGRSPIPAMAPPRPPPMAAPPPQQQQPPPFQARGSLSSLVKQPDAEMDQRWREAEGNALSQSGYTGGGQSYGWGEAARDFLPMAAAGSLDVLVNKGQGLGQIMQAAGDQNAIGEKNRFAKSQAAGGFAQTARNQRESQKGSAMDAAYKDAQIQNWNEQRRLAQGNLDQRDIKQKFAETKARLEQDPNDPQALSMADQLAELTGMDVRGQLGARNIGRMMPVAGRQQQLQNAEPMADAKNRSDLNFAAPQAAATQVGAESGKLAAAPTTKAKNEALGEVPEVTKRNEDAQTKYATANSKIISAYSDIQAINGRRNPDGTIPGFDMASRALNSVWGGSNFTSKDTQNNMQDAAAIADKLQRADSGAAAPVQEAAGFVTRAFSDPLATEQTRRNAFENLQRKIEEQLNAGAVQPDAAQQVVDRASPGGQSKLRLGTKPRGAPSGGMANGPPAPAAGGGGAASGVKLEPSGMADGSFYAIDTKTGRRKRISKEAAAGLQ